MAGTHAYTLQTKPKLVSSTILSFKMSFNNEAEIITFLIEKS